MNLEMQFGNRSVLVIQSGSGGEIDKFIYFKMEIWKGKCGVGYISLCSLLSFIFKLLKIR